VAVILALSAKGKPDYKGDDHANPKVEVDVAGEGQR
jgi:hypothetical protein